MTVQVQLNIFPLELMSSTTASKVKWPSFFIHVHSLSNLLGILLAVSKRLEQFVFYCCPPVAAS